jgi:hypothetical protein
VIFHQNYDRAGWHQGYQTVRRRHTLARNVHINDRI